MLPVLNAEKNGLPVFADVAQVVAHILGKDEVMGPNPIISSSLVQ